jgi:hypothetical protein
MFLTFYECRELPIVIVYHRQTQIDRVYAAKIVFVKRRQAVSALICCFIMTIDDKIESGFAFVDGG